MKKEDLVPPKMVEDMRKKAQLRKKSDIFENKMREACLLYTSPSPRDRQKSRMPSSA